MGAIPANIPALPELDPKDNWGRKLNEALLARTSPEYVSKVMPDHLRESDLDTRIKKLAVPGPAGKDSTVPGPAGPAGPAGKDSTVPGPAGPAGKDSTVPGPAGPVGKDSTVPGPAGPAGKDSTVPGPAGPAGKDSTVPGPAGPAGKDGTQIVSVASFADAPALPVGTIVLSMSGT